MSPRATPKKPGGGLFAGRRTVGTKIKALIRSGQDQEDTFATMASKQAGMKKQPGYKLKGMVKSMKGGY